MSTIECFNFDGFEVLQHGLRFFSPPQPRKITIFAVYDVLTGAVVSKLSGHDACVRDVSWHPYEDNIVSSSVSSFTFTSMPL